jgi:hypothetical protein
VIVNFVFSVVIPLVCSLRPARAYRNTPYNYIPSLRLLRSSRLNSSYLRDFVSFVVKFVF